MQHATCNMPQTAYKKTMHTYTIHQSLSSARMQGPKLNLNPLVAYAHGGGCCTRHICIAHVAWCMLHVLHAAVAGCLLHAACCTLHDTCCAVACLRVAPVRAIMGNCPTLTPHDAARGNTYLQAHDVSNATRCEGLQHAARGCKGLQPLTA